ncbi:hypothetical protein DFH09DRAFT_1211287 [Mycena vulgaris]|nr:hypothetical protein DFH09DRAFT_1211287 [Mycena vulgaris]
MRGGSRRKRVSLLQILLQILSSFPFRFTSFHLSCPLFVFPHRSRLEWRLIGILIDPRATCALLLPARFSHPFLASHSYPSSLPPSPFFRPRCLPFSN